MVQLSTVHNLGSNKVIFIKDFLNVDIEKTLSNFITVLFSNVYLPTIIYVNYDDIASAEKSFPRYLTMRL